jgi:hypothetical protein
MQPTKKAYATKNTKFELIREIVAGKTSIDIAKTMSLLDVGCRDCQLKKYVSDLGLSYSGVDLFQNSDNSVDFVSSLEDGLPLSDNTYDFVVALDIVEHLNDFEYGLLELARVTKRYLIIMLPNMAYAPLRKEFLLKGSFSRVTDKYDLTYGLANKQVDRHRWLTVIPQMDEYLSDFAKNNSFELETIWFSPKGKRLLFVNLAKSLNLPPSLWVTASLYILRRIA